MKRKQKIAHLILQISFFNGIRQMRCTKCDVEESVHDLNVYILLVN